MPKPIQVWIPDGWMENHRDQENTDDFKKALKQERVYVVDGPVGDGWDCDMAFIGSWKYYPESREYRNRNPGKPVVHYNWDIYPFQVNEKTDPKTDRTGRARPTPQATRWGEYLEELRYATEVWVPSSGVVSRTREFAGPNVRCEVVKCNCFPWEDTPRGNDWGQVAGVDLSRPYVMDVLREYTGEPMVGKVGLACQSLQNIGVDIQCLQAGHRLTWDEFRSAVLRAKVLVSAYNEASTGGLTLLEGYYHGVPVLVSDSPMNGAGEYFGRDRGYYFSAGDVEDLAGWIRTILDEYRPTPAQTLGNRRWVKDEYGVQAFTRRLAAGFRRVLG